MNYQYVIFPFKVLYARMVTIKIKESDKSFQIF